MAEKVTIEIVAQMVDNTNAAMKQLEQKLEGMEKRIARLDKMTANLRLYADTGSAEKKLDDVEKRTSKLDGSKTTAKLDALDNASKVIGTVTSKAEQLAGKMFKFGIGAIDGATTVMSKVGATAKGLAGGVYNLTLGVIDKVTAPAQKIISGLNSALGIAGLGLGGYGLVVKPIEMQVDYENLVTSFDVLLGGPDKAEKRIQQLTDFAGKTPFTRDELYNSNRILEVYSKGAISSDPEQRGGMKMVGDIAASVPNGDYQTVASWIGRMYSSMENGGAVGMMTSALQDMGALGGPDREKIEKLSENVKNGTMNIEQAWDGVADIFSRFDGTMEMQADKLGNLLLGVKSAFTNNVLKKLGAGFSEGLTPFLKDFRTWRSENSELIAGWAEQVQTFARTISTKATTAVRNLAGDISDMVSGDDWKAASFAGKINIAWNKMIVEPFSSWWQDSGRDKIADMLGSFGENLGEGVSNGLLFLLGIDVNGAVNDGASIGSAFIQGFKSRFDTKAVSDAFKDAVSNLPSIVENIWGKVKNGFTSLKATFQEVIFDPLAEWWGGGGKETVISGAAQLGTWLGEGITQGIQFLSSGILSLLGIENDGVLSEAADVGKGFWDSFTSALDGAAITRALTDAISGVWSALPSWAQALITGYGVSKLFSGVSPVISSMGTAGKLLGSASGGTGLLGFGANAAIKLSGGNSAFGSTLSAGGLSGLGLGATAGGIVGGVTLISGAGDIVSAVNTEGSERTYNSVKGGSKIGGVGIGAAIGTAILPGVGTLIGAGLGGLVGTFGGEALAKGISGYDEEDIKRIQALEPAMVGYSEATKTAIRQSKLTATELNNIKKTKLDEWYGDVSLSLKEISERGQRVFEKVLGSETVTLMSEYETAIEDSNAALKSMDSSLAKMNSKKYKLEIGASLSETDSADYVSFVDSYVSGVQDYISRQRYAVELSARIILGENSSFGAEADEYWTALESQVLTLKNQLHEFIQSALDGDGKSPFVIDADEQEVIDGYIEQIRRIEEGIREAESKIELQTLKLNYGDPYDLDWDSTVGILDEFGRREKEGIEALNRNRATLDYQNDLMYAKDGDLDAYNKRAKSNAEKHVAGKTEIKQRYAEEMIPYLTASAQNAAADIQDADQIVFDAIAKGLNLEDVKYLFNDYQSTEGWYHDVLKTINGGTVVAEITAQADLMQQQLSAIKTLFDDSGIEPPEWITEGLIKAEELLNLDNIDLSKIDATELFEQIASAFEASGDIDFAAIMRDKITGGELDGASAGLKQHGDNYGLLFAEGIISGIEAADISGAQGAIDGKKSETDGMVISTFSRPVNVTQPINVTFSTNYLNTPQIYNPSIPAWNIGGNAAGDIVGSKQLSWLAEEGWPEAVIPFNPARRGRALGLWQETGKRLGVLENAAGGIVGDGYGRVSIPEYSGSRSQSTSGGGNTITIAAGAVQITVKAAEGQSVTEVINENLENIGQKVAEVFVEKLGPQFENTPVKVG